MNRRVLRPLRFLVIIPSVLLVVSIAALIITLIGKAEMIALVSCVFMLLVSLIVIGNFCRTSIILDESTIVSQTFFKTHICEFREIMQIETKAIVTPTIHGMTNTPMVVLYTGNKKVIVLIKSFSRRNLKEMAQWLINHCGHASINRATVEMSDGKMPSAFRNNRNSRK